MSSVPIQNLPSFAPGLLILLIVIAVCGPARAQDAEEKTITITKSALSKLIRDEVQRQLRQRPNERAQTAKPVVSAKATSESNPSREAVVPSAGIKDLSATARKKLEEYKIEASSTSKVREFSSLFDVPNSPAASALGLNPDTMPKATLPKQFNLSNINGVDIRGNPQTGLAVDVAPGQLFFLTRKASAKSLQEYANSYWIRLGMRAQVSFAEARGTTADDKSLRVAGGFNLPLIVGNDAVHETAAKAEKTSGTVKVDGAKFVSLNSPLIAEEGDDESIWTDNSRNPPIPLGKLGNFLWDHSDLALGGYSLVASKSGDTDFRYGGSVFYGTWDFDLYSKRRESFLQLVTNVTYRDSELLPPASAGVSDANKNSKSFVEQDQLQFGGGLRMGKKALNLTAFGAWIKIWERNGGSGDAYRYGALLEYQVPTFNNVWITASAGEEIASAHRADSTFVLGGVKIGLGAESFANPAPSKDPAK